ncbi:MAG: repair protein SbcC/Rad50 [Chthoniobacter sp.]|jgi:exonuclease SbcC|nr:repair protein SbcC/Rad50 [Chthoniobacter sp.]
MIIRSIRLKNIKSYGEGADGHGTTVHFQPGINRIAGQNGHGKSTLIEALGYALFLAKPLCEETFDAATYLLRAGHKAGEIDVTFEHGGQAYRLERGLGIQNQRRTKVVQISDGSIAEENDEPVADFLCRLFGFPDAERLCELFAKLAGVKQGRLTWPFDSKPGDARKHFEPLLDVEIFRQCFDRLKPVVDQFERQRFAEENKLAAVRERLRERQDSAAQAKARRSQVDALHLEVESAKALFQAAEQAKQTLEAKEKALFEAQRDRDSAQHALAVSVQQREHAAQRLKESSAAAAVLAQTSADHEAFTRAEAALNQLHEEQTEKAALEKQRSEALTRRAECDGKASGAGEQAATFASQRETKAKSRAQIEEMAKQLRTSLAQSQPLFEQLALSIAQTRHDEQTLRHWLDGLPKRIAAQAAHGKELEEIGETLAAWDAEALCTARKAEQAAGAQLENLSGQLAATRDAHQNLSIQLEEIGGGVCPFLKERCQQFDPAKVRGDLREKESAFKSLGKQLLAARETHRQAKAALDKLAAQEAQLGQVRKNFDQRFAEFLAEHNALHAASTREAACRLAKLLEGVAPFETLPPVIRETCFQNDGSTWRTGAASEISRAGSAFADGARAWLDGIAPALKTRFTDFDAERDQRLAHERDLNHHDRQLEVLSREIESLTARAEAKTQETGRWRANVEAEAKTVGDLDEKLKPFATLDQRVRAQQELKKQHGEGHGRHLAAKPLADQLGDRRLEVETLEKSATQAAGQLQLKDEALKQAQQAFDPQALDSARRAFHEKHAQVATLTANLVNARAGLAREEQRLREFEAALSESEALEVEIGRLGAAIDLTEKARRVLQKAAPSVAQHLCRRIAARGQQIFNQISQDPCELEWNSERYSLRIHPGDRRFAMLSGGEQTKLALAMTLAMIQEFSGLKFCVFDEPTYGVDAESRPKLADAILEVQNAAAFEQLFLVSHDDAFEGKIEHVILLKKSATGTQVEAA